MKAETYHDVDYVIEWSVYGLIEGDYISSAPGGRDVNLAQAQRCIQHVIDTLGDSHDESDDKWLWDLYKELLSDEEALLSLVVEAYRHGWVGPEGLVENQVPEWAGAIAPARDCIARIHQKHFPINPENQVPSPYPSTPLAFQRTDRDKQTDPKVRL